MINIIENKVRKLSVRFLKIWLESLGKKWKICKESKSHRPTGLYVQVGIWLLSNTGLEGGNTFTESLTQNKPTYQNCRTHFYTQPI